MSRSSSRHPSLASSPTPRSSVSSIKSPSGILVGNTFSGHCTSKDAVFRVLIGIDFTVPRTSSFVAYALRGKVTIFDFITVGLGVLSAALFLSGRVPRILFLLSFAVWRIAYNVGLGWILERQSRQEWWTELTRPIFERRDGAQRFSLLHLGLKTKLPHDYSLQVCDESPCSGAH